MYKLIIGIKNNLQCNFLHISSNLVNREVGNRFIKCNEMQIAVFYFIFCLMFQFNLPVLFDLRNIFYSTDSCQVRLSLCMILFIFQFIVIVKFILCTLYYAVLSVFKTLKVSSFDSIIIFILICNQTS